MALFFWRMPIIWRLWLKLSEEHAKAKPDAFRKKHVVFWHTGRDSWMQTKRHVLQFVLLVCVNSINIAT